MAGGGTEPVTNTMGEWVPGVTKPTATQHPQQSHPWPLHPQQPDTAAPVDLAAASEQAALIRQGFERLAQKYALGSGQTEQKVAPAAPATAAAATTPVDHQATETALQFHSGAAIHRPTELGWRQNESTYWGGDAASHADQRLLGQYPGAHTREQTSGQNDEHRLGGVLETPHRRQPVETQAIEPARQAWSDSDRAGREQYGSLGGTLAGLGDENHEQLEDHHRHPGEMQAIEPARQAWSDSDRAGRERYGSLGGTLAGLGDENHEQLEAHHRHPGGMQAIEPARQAWSDSDRARRERYGSLGGTLAGLGGLPPGAEEMREADVWHQRQQQEALKRALQTQMYERKARALRSECDSIDEGCRPPQLWGRVDHYQGQSKPDWQVQPEPEPEPEPEPKPEPVPEPEANGYSRQNGIGISSPLSSPEPRQHQRGHCDYNEGLACAESNYSHTQAHDLFEHQDLRQETMKESPANTGNNVPDAAAGDVDAQLESVGRRIETLLRASAEEKLAKEITQIAPTAAESYCDKDADTEEIEEVIDAEADSQFSDDEDWLPSSVKPLRVRARPDPFSVEASLGGRPSSFISIASGVNSTLPATLATDLGVDLGRHSIALESTSRFVDVQARFDDLFQEE